MLEQERGLPERDTEVISEGDPKAHVLSSAGKENDFHQTEEKPKEGRNVKWLLLGSLTSLQIGNARELHRQNG